MGQPGDPKEEEQRRPAEELALEPLTSAIQRLTGANPDLAKATTPIAAEFALGRAAADMQSFSELDPERSPTDTGLWLTLLRLERSRETKDFGQLARELPRLMVQPSPSAECCFISAVFAEKVGDVDAARRHYQAAMLSATAREAAVRAQSEHAADTAAMFRALSAHTTDAGQRSLLLTEALFRLAVEAPEFDALADEAARTDPHLPFAFQLAETAARLRGDRTRVGRWLARQRERARGAGDFALTAIQQALFVAQNR